MRGGSSAGRTTASELNPQSRAGRERRPVDGMRGGQVLHREPQRFEQGDLMARPPPGDPPQKNVSDLSGDVLVPERAFGPGNQELSRLVERRFLSIDVEPRAADR